ncbi:MFS transporter [Bacillus sp. Marseille-Q7846]
MQIKYIKKYKTLILFLTLFYLSMGASKYVHVLWFEKNKSVFSYSLSYSAMAIAGSFSFLLGKYISKLSIQKNILIFLPIYMLGMSLRIFTEPIILPVISGFISGIGASIVILIIRNWMFELINQNPEDKSEILSSRIIIMQLMITLGTIISGQILFIFNENNSIYIILLMLSAFSLSSCLFIKKIPNKRLENNNNIKLLPKNKKLTLLITSLCILIGISMGMLEPYYPIILKKVGYNVSIISIIMSLYTIFKILGSFIFKKKFFTLKPQITLFCIEILLSIMFFSSGLFPETKLIIIPILFSSILISGVLITKEITEYNILPKKELPIYFGILQSAFLIGDSLGNPIGGFLYTNTNTSTMLFSYSLINLIIGISYLCLYSYITKKKGLN